MKNHKTILLVDDEETIRTSLAFNLKHSGFQVVTAADGGAGLERLQKRDVDLVITDLMMANVGGLQLLGEIRKYDQDLPVIVLTGYGDLPSAIESLRQGANDYLLKPCEFGELVDRINHCLGEKPAGEPARPARPPAEGRAQQGSMFFLGQARLSVEKTKMVKMEWALRKSRRQIIEKERLLAEANGALRLLMKSVAEEKAEGVQQIVQQIHATVLPYVHRLQMGSLTKQQQLLLETIEAQLQHLGSAASSKGKKDIYFNFTPMETKVANLIRAGQATKEIAALLNVSPRTVETHRQNIRKKAGLRHKTGNLQAILSAT